MTVLHLMWLAGYVGVGAISVAGAQGHTDFSGTWTQVADSAGTRPTVAATGDASFRTGDMGSGWGSPLTITQRTDSLILEYTVFSRYDLQPPLRLAYPLDGSETRNTVMIGHSESVQRGRVTWQGEALVITTFHAAPASGRGPAPVTEMRQALTLESPTSLVVQTTRAGIGGGPNTATRTMYARTR